MELRHTAIFGGRLSTVLKEEMKMSTGLMNRLKWQDLLFVNGVPQHTDFAVNPGDVITVPMDEPEPDYPAEDGELTILYEDDHILAVDKPAGMLIHPSHCKNTGTLANRVLGYFHRMGQHCAFHPVTRLDRDTFGIVLLGKNSHIHRLLQECDMVKIYHAMTLGGPVEDEGTIDAPIARRPLPSLLREVREDGKPSLTEYRVLERKGNLCKLALRPITGRTHQLRVHCAHMGYPILGDPQYGSEESKMDLPSQLLCAHSLEFDHPMTGKHLILVSKMDADY